MKEVQERGPSGVGPLTEGDARRLWGCIVFCCAREARPTAEALAEAFPGPDWLGFYREDFES